jgi:hypothetical protein
VHAFRRDELHLIQLTLEAAKPDAWALTVNDNPLGARNRKRWLGTD